MSQVARHLFRPATLRVFPEAVSLRQNPDRPPAANGNRRRDRLFLPRQRPRSARNANHPASPQDRRAGAAQLRFRQQDSAEILAALSQAQCPRTGKPRRRCNCAHSSNRRWVEAFQEYHADDVADFCLEMYRRMGLLDGIRVVRSSDPDVSPRRLRHRRISSSMCLMRARSCAPGSTRRRPQAARRRRCSTSTLPPMPIHQGANQPDARHPAALDAIGPPLHALCCRRRRTRLPRARKMRRKSLFVNRDTIERSDEAYTDIPA